MSQLPTVTNGYYRMFEYSSVSIYNIDINDLIKRDEMIGSTKRVHELFISKNYPDILFYITTDFNNNPQKPDLGIIRQKNFVYRNMDSNLKSEVNYILQNKKDNFYKYNNLNIIFNHSLIGECS